MTKETSFTLEEKCEQIKDAFAHASNRERIYEKIMEFGKTLSPFQKEWKNEENLVSGCQSLLYLHTTSRLGALYFSASSDALISAGLAALLIFLYSGEFPANIIKNPPRILEELGIPALLSPSRANGLASLYLKMREEAIKEGVKQALAGIGSQLSS